MATTRPSSCSEEAHHIPQDPIYMWTANIMARLGFAITANYKLSLFGFRRKPSYQQRNLIIHLRKRICQKIAPFGGFMTRPEWQKKKKKMAGREGPKKGKNR
ncbi:hypothetical protein E6H28_03060 [Candidatus Bathyarchaeota archaeon]|nr:MAG: hypothetical protein E6H28_03060 [Candidatus Bathyarchaeota archaeon]